MVFWKEGPIHDLITISKKGYEKLPSTFIIVHTAVLQDHHRSGQEDKDRCRVFNPGPIFSIPGFGIGGFLIPGSRRDYGIPAV